MDSTLKNYGSLIEKIRKDRKLSREALCEGIMSKRNYQRFASGEVSISSDKILRLIDQLGLDIYSIQDLHKKLYADEYSKIIKAFNHVSQWNFEKAILTHATIDADLITSKLNLKIYQLTDLLIKRHKGTVMDSNFYSQIEALVDYPNVLKKKILNRLEMNALFILSKKYIEKKDPAIIDFFVNLVREYSINEYWLSDEYMALIFIYITRGIYRFKRYEECIEFCNQGLKYCKKSERFTGVGNLFGYKALSLNKLGFNEEAIAQTKRLHMFLTLEDNDLKTDKYMNVVLDNLKITLEDLEQ